MPFVERPEELVEFDDEYAYFRGDYSQLTEAYEEIAAVFQTFSRSLGISLVPEDPSGFQDGSLLTVAQECFSDSRSPQSRTEVLGGFYFSRYARLFFGGSLDRRSRIQLTQWNAMRNALQNEYAFVLVDDQALDSKYSGVHEKFSAMSWRERFFAPWYQRLDVGAA